MKVVIFLLSFVIFAAGFAGMAYADQFEGVLDGWGASLMFAGGILATCVAFMIPFHLLEKFD